jgi:peptidoglycan/xylan/chitin deacetylase (PgdA/CDA1 family)
MNAADIAFVIPAYNAERTLEKCLDSLLAQTRTAWEAIVVDDGSSDGTLALASRYAAADPRIRVVSQPNAGASAARNNGVGQARASYLTLLDSDDWIDPTFIDVMLPVAMERQGRAVAYCSYRRVKDGGEMLPVSWAPDLSGERAMRDFPVSCVIAIHTAVLPRAAYLAAGGMTTTMTTCEDWELWLKIAYADIEFIRVEACLAYYRITPGSLTRNPVSLVRDTVALTESSERVRAERQRRLPDVPLPETLPPALVQIWMLAWATAASIGGPHSPEELAALLPSVGNVQGHEDFVSATTIDGLMITYECGTPPELVAHLADWQPRIERLFSLLESGSVPGEGRSLWTALVQQMFCASGPGGTVVIGGIAVVEIDVDRLAPIAKPPADSCVVIFTRAGKVFTSAVTPVWGDLSAHSLALILARRLPLRSSAGLAGAPAFVGGALGEAFRQRRQIAKGFLRKDFRKTRLKQVLRTIKLAATEAGHAATSDDNEAVARRIIERIRTDLPPVAATVVVEDGKAVDDQTHAKSQDYWEGIFAKADPWNYLSVYEQVKYRQTLDLVDDRPIGSALEIACAEGIFTENLCKRVETLIAVDISQRAIDRAAERCAAFSNIRFGQLDLLKDEYPPDQDLIVCSEVLYYMDTVDQIRDIAKKICGAMKEGGQFVTAHAHLIADDMGRTGFDWGNPFGVDTLCRVFSETPGLVLEKTIDTDLYAIHSFRKTAAPAAAAPVFVRADFGGPLEPEVSKYVMWGGAVKLRGAAWNEETTPRVPVLMYHRIADDGPEALARYRTSPQAFREQLRFLRRHGFYSIDSDALRRHARDLKPFKGRPVLITFDDAYLDFAEVAYPLLYENDFNAEVFVVTDKVGQESDWDAAYGASSPLMDWDDIARMQGKGVHFGSHLATHTPATALSSADLLAEAARSRLVLGQRLGRDVTSIALPYGLQDARTEPTLAIAGYEVAFMTKPGMASVTQSTMQVPRFEVYRDIPIATFGELVGIV